MKSSARKTLKVEAWRRRLEPIYVTPDESHICGIIGVGSLTDLRGGFPNDMLNLGALVLATKAVPRILFEFFRRQQRDRKDSTDRIHELLALPAWTFGIGQESLTTGSSGRH
jgi:hypothetical protein